MTSAYVQIIDAAETSFACFLRRAALYKGGVTVDPSEALTVFEACARKASRLAWSSMQAKQVSELLSWPP